MTTKGPDEIRAEIDRTRAELQNDANRLSEKVTPTKVMERKVDGLRESVMGAKEKVLGAAHDTGSSIGSMGSSVGSTLSDTAGSGVSTLTESPAKVKQQAAGSPLVAAAVAFGAGYLLSALLPSTQKEQQLAGQAKDVAMQAQQPVKESLQTAVSDMKDELAPQAADAVQAVKESGTSAAEAVKDTATSAAGDVKDQAADSAATVKDAAPTAGSPSGSSPAAGSSSVPGTYTAAAPLGAPGGPLR